DDTLFDRIQGMVGVLEVVTPVDADIIADPAVLVDDGIADIAAMSDAYGRQAMLPGQLDLLDGLVIVYPHEIAADDGRPGTDTGADADDAVLDPRGIDDTALGDDRLFQRRAADLGRGQHPCPRIDRLFVVEEIEIRNVLCKTQVGLEKGRDIPDIGPVAVVLIAYHLIFLEALGNDLLAEIGG